MPCLPTHFSVQLFGGSYKALSLPQAKFTQPAFRLAWLTLYILLAPSLSKSTMIV